MLREVNSQHSVPWSVTRAVTLAWQGVQGLSSPGARWALKPEAGSGAGAGQTPCVQPGSPTLLKMPTLGSTESAVRCSLPHSWVFGSLGSKPRWSGLELERRTLTECGLSQLSLSSLSVGPTGPAAPQSLSWKEAEVAGRLCSRSLIPLHPGAQTWTLELSPWAPGPSAAGLGPPPLSGLDVPLTPLSCHPDLCLQGNAGLT